MLNEYSVLAKFPEFPSGHAEQLARAQAADPAHAVFLAWGDIRTRPDVRRKHITKAIFTVVLMPRRKAVGA
jgi:hypothetical protein